MKKQTQRGVVFLDRDGVINVDRKDYVRSWSEFRFLPGVFEAIRLLNKNKIRAVVVTNQSAVNRGLMSINTLKEIHRKMLTEIRKHGGRIEAIYYCPHTPSENCDCRKPKPGMVLKAMRDLQIDLTSSYVVGDSEKEVELARSLEMKCVQISEKIPGKPSTKGHGWTFKWPVRAQSLHEAVSYISQDLKESLPS